MQASELRAGQFFEWDDQRWLCVRVRKATTIVTDENATLVRLALDTLVNPDCPQCWGDGEEAKAGDCPQLSGTDWRLIEDGDVILDGDEFSNDDGCTWLASSCVGYRKLPSWRWLYRRKIAGVPTPPAPAEQASQPLASEQEDAADLAAVAASKAEGVYVPLDKGLAEVEQALVAGDLKLREGGWYRQHCGMVRGPLKPKDDGSPFVWQVRDEHGWDSWLSNGRWSQGHECAKDLIAEVPDPSWQPHDGGQ